MSKACVFLWRTFAVGLWVTAGIVADFAMTPRDTRIVGLWWWVGACLWAAIFWVLWERLFRSAER
jgi:hypothetical protein